MLLYSIYVNYLFLKEILLILLVLSLFGSFDVNHPGKESQNLKGVIAWGTLVREVLKVGEVV
jgi:translation initiation factor 2 gamma subunit (eIF-2gamma)